MLEIRITETGSQIDGTTGDYTKYGLEFAFERIDDGSYDLQDFRLRGFFNHHYSLTVLSDIGYYALREFQIFQGAAVGQILSAGYDDWMNDIRPPRIDTNKFASEVIAWLPTATLNASTPLTYQGSGKLMGYWNGDHKLGRYNDTRESYSFIEASTTATNPLTWVFEKRDNTRTINMSSISSVGNVVTVTTSGSHGFSTGDAVFITGLNSDPRQFGNAGERYEGTFTITVTGASTFQYITKHEVTAATHSSTGRVEFWEVFVYEQAITSIQGDGAGSVTIETARNHSLQVDDVIAIEGTSNYDGAQLTVITRNSSTSVVCTITGNTSSTLETVGRILYSSKPPSGAISVNYIAGYEPLLYDDHTSFTYLRYADKDTYIDNLIANDYGASTQLLVRNFASNTPPNYQRMVFRFPIAGIPLSELIFAEINAIYASGSDGDAVMTLYQMTSDSWSNSDTWDTINPLIDEADPIGLYNFINVSTGENNTYTKFDVDVDKISSWITGEHVPDVGFVKVATVNSQSNVYWSSETVEYKPYIVVSSGVVADQYPPTIHLTNATNTLSVVTSQGDGVGNILVDMGTAHHMSAGDLVDVITPTYQAFGTSVLGGGYSPTTNAFYINIPGNTSVVIDNGGVIVQYNVIEVSAVGIDDVEMSDDPADLIIRKTASHTIVTPTNIVKSPSTQTSFDFVLNDLDDGYFDVSVKDATGNQSSIIAPPLLMYHYGHESGIPCEVVTSGMTVDIVGFNVDSPLTAIIADDFLTGGVISGGITQSVGIGDIDAGNNLFTISIPSGTQLEYDVISVNDVTDTILVANSELKIGDNIVFNSTGNHMNDPLLVGCLYFVVAATQIGSDTEIQISTTYMGTALGLDVSPVDMNMVVYNYSTPLYVQKNGFDSSDYGNLSHIRLDDYPPKFEIDTIVGSGVDINVTISDIYPIDQSSVSFVNGTQTATPIVDVNGDGRVLIYEVHITGVGTFRVDAADELGNSSYATADVPPVETPFIEVTGYTITDQNNFVLNVHVIDDNIDPVEAPNNYTAGVFVEGSIENSTFGVVGNLTSVADGITFTITVDSLGDGIMTIYARDLDDNNNYIQPPVLTSITPECISNNSEVYFTGLNLAQESFINRQFLNPLVSITSSTMTTINAYVASGSPDGNFNFTLTVNQDSLTMISNTLTGILDNTPPIINIIGDQIMEVIQGESYTELGATATDNIYGDVTSSIVTQGIVNTNVLGTYYIAYTASDPCGNSSIAIRQVNVVTGCPVYISVSPSSEYVGGLVTVTATLGEFNPVPVNNIVTFNGIVGTVVGGNRSAIQVIVPFGATSGPVQVETGPTNTGYEECSLSNIYQFTVLYENEEFIDNQDTATRNKRGKATTNSGRISPFERGAERTAIYNRDLGYSGYSEIVDENSMIQNLYSIVLTRVGERIFNPEFGTDIEDFIHNIIYDVNEFELKSIRSIVDAVKRFEPRITIVEEDSFISFDPDKNDAKVILKVLVPSGSVRVIGISLKSMRNGEANI
jgi:phage baseplate assembly protein W